MRTKLLVIGASIVMVLFAIAVWMSNAPHTFGATTLQTVQGGTGTSSPSGILYGSGSSNPLKTVTIGSNLTFSGGTLTASGDGTFSTTSAAYFTSVGLAFSTTSNNYWKTQSVFTGASTTLLSDINTFSGLTAFSNSGTTTFTGGINFTRFNLTATSTGSQGINLAGGCFAVSGTCLQTFIQNATAYKQAVNYATAAVLSGTPTYSNGVSGVGATLTEIGLGALSVDGQGVVAGQRILVKDQVDQTTNGIYVVTNAGSGIANYVLTRSTDYDETTDVYAGTTVPVLAGGTANADTQWTETTTGTIVMGTSNIAFEETAFGTNAVTSLAAGAPLYVSASIGAVTVNTSFSTSSINVFSALNTFGNGFVSQASSSFLTLNGVSATSTNFFATNSNSTNASSSALTVSGVRSALGLFSATGVLSAYGGASGCSSQFVTAISAVGGTTCTSVTDGTFSGQLTVAHGGTGQSTLTSNGILYGQGTGAIGITASSASSILVTNSSGVPSLSTTLPAFTLGGSVAGNGQTITGNIVLTNATSTTFFSTTASSTNLFSNAATIGSLTTGALTANGNSTFANATSTTFFTTTASSTNLFSNTATIGTFTGGNGSFTGTLSVTGLSTLTGGFFSNASSTIASSFNVSGASTLGTLTAVAATSTNLFATYASSTNLSTLNGTSTNFAAVYGQITNATSTTLFATTASSSALFSNTATIGALTGGTGTFAGTLGVTGLSTLTGGFISAASSSFTTLSGGTASTTNLTISGINGTANNCLQVSAAGLVSGTGGACGGTAAWPFTPNAAGFFNQLSNSTTTQLHLGGSPTSLSASSTSKFDAINVIYATTSFASTTAGTFTSLYTGVTSALLLGNSGGLVGSASTQTCTNQFVRAMSAAYAATCATVAPTDIDLTATFAWTGLHTWSGRMGIGSTTPSALWGIGIGTTTVIGNAGFASLIASSTANTALITPDFSTGNHKRYILQQNTNLDLNSTSSNPIDGMNVSIDVCQDNTGSRTLTFSYADKIVFYVDGATTTINSRANTMTKLGLTYDGRVSRWFMMATSTSADIRACKP